MSMRFVVPTLLLSCVVAFAALAGDKAAPAPAPAKAPAVVKASLTNFADLKWAPFDPSQPKGLQVSVVTGDMKGPSSFFLKVPAGGKSGVHAHTADYTAVVIAGAPAHAATEKDAVKGLAVGSTWFQPGKEMHFDACTGAVDCVMFINFAGGPDMIAAPAAAAKK